MMQKKYLLVSSFVFLNMIGFATPVLAAKPVNIDVQPTGKIKSVLTKAQYANQVGFKKISTATDFQNVTHVRYQETYLGYPVWGAQIVTHSFGQNEASLNESMKNASSTVNGVIYEDINKDLSITSVTFNAAQAEKALKFAVQAFENKKGNSRYTIKQTKSELMVYIDKDNKAHWAFLVGFTAEPLNAIWEKPTYIIDAATFKIYHEWNEVKKVHEVERRPVLGGGFGGNIKSGKYSYDGLAGNLPSLSMTRDAGMCFLQNKTVTVKDYRKPTALGPEIVAFECKARDSKHNNIFWNADFDAVNEGFSPSNDALYAGKIITSMYQTWYKVAPLSENNQPMMLNMLVHLDDENAYWDGEKMIFGDGATVFYPLTSLGVGAHEVSHGFTQQHSNLFYSDSQSGGLNESFSDMAAQAAEYFATGTNSWQIGPEIFKQPGQALRYMDEPTKDCPEGRQPGDWCSIEHLSQFQEYTDVHFTSGIFNKVFYLLGTAPGWDTKKAFDVMVKANMAYWRPTTDFHNAANCVMKAAQDLDYDLSAIKAAFDAVGLWGVNTTNCV